MIFLLARAIISASKISLICGIFVKLAIRPKYLMFIPCTCMPDIMDSLSTGTSSSYSNFRKREGIALFYRSYPNSANYKSSFSDSLLL